MTNTTDTNQASEELQEQILGICYKLSINAHNNNQPGLVDYARECSDELMKLIRTEKLKLLAELDKSMPTAEQLTTKYGYHMPEKQYGYKLALHDIREVLTKMEAEL